MNSKKILALTLLISSTFTSVAFAGENREVNDNNVDTTINYGVVLSSPEVNASENSVYVEYGEITSVGDNTFTFKPYKADTIESTYDLNVPVVNSETKSAGLLEINKPVYINLKLVDGQPVIQSIISNIQNNAKDASFIEVKSIEKEENKIKIIDSNNSVYLYLDNNTNYLSYKTKEIVTASDIVVGSKLFVWEDVNENTPTTLQLPQVKTVSDCIVINETINGWVKHNDNWSYYIDNERVTGWYNDNGTWYYLNNDGVMNTGWILDKGNWYFCGESGGMLSNTTIDGYYLDSTGAWQK